MDKNSTRKKTKMKEYLTRENDRLYGELVDALLTAAVESWNVLLLPKCVGLRKHSLYMSEVALLKSP